MEVLMLDMPGWTKRKRKGNLNSISTVSRRQLSDHGKVYDLDHGQLSLMMGDCVVWRPPRGQELGEWCLWQRETPAAPLKPVCGWYWRTNRRRLTLK
jgi:hypothetical protein